ncbi:hypothetical protein BGZ95_005542 [Linnemannia exigua]|uniref:Tc1-like transposase DDE domain-containing protein n=1 Tax=Linnemannia exigua TaxID=604196 RepID=A0AAD4H145_9FUNG|nr:hypothetical protein BGZ95_005542 [Linnemannia exigua]
MDNARFHKTQKVQDAITTGGHTLLLLPSYSPHLNAAEPVFSSVKTYVIQEVVEAETLAGQVRGSEVGRNFQISLAGAPLGRLYDIRQALPEEHQEEEEVREGIDEDNEDEEEEGIDEDEEGDIDEDEEGDIDEDEEGNGDNQGEEIDGDEGDDVWDGAHRKYSPLRTRSGKMRN